MRRRALLLGLLALPGLGVRPAHADPTAAQMEAATDAAMAFMKALRRKKLDDALARVDAPFVAEDAQLLATKADVKAYLTEMLQNAEASVLPNAVLGVLDYEQSRAMTDAAALKLRDAVLKKGDLLVGIGRDGVSRGVLLVHNGAGKPVIVGVGY